MKTRIAWQEVDVHPVFAPAKEPRSINDDVFIFFDFILGFLTSFLPLPCSLHPCLFACHVGSNKVPFKMTFHQITTLALTDPHHHHQQSILNYFPSFSVHSAPSLTLLPFSIGSKPGVFNAAWLNLKKRTQTIVEHRAAKNISAFYR